MATGAVAGSVDPLLQSRQAALGSLADQIRAYVGRINRSSVESAREIAPLLRALQHYDELVDLAGGGQDSGDASHAGLEEATLRVLAGADTTGDSYNAARLESEMGDVETRYQETKAELLHEAAAGHLTVEDLERRIERAAWVRRIAERATKAAHRLTPLLPSATLPGEQADPA